MGQAYSKERLFQAIDSNDFKTVKQLLAYDPGLVNEYFDSYKGSLPVMRPIWNNNIKMFDLLITFGADINKRTANGYTAVFFAAERGRTNILTKLLEMQHCKIDLSTEKGLSPLDLAILNGYYNCALLLVKNVS